MVITNKIAVIAGTSEATEIISAISHKYRVTAFVATHLGKEILSDYKCDVRIGKLNKSEFITLLSDNQFNAVIDASHPFAVEVTQNIKNACNELNLPYLRVSRPSTSYSYDRLIRTESKETAISLLNQRRGKIFFTTGANTLSFYARNVNNFKERAVARILDTDFSRSTTKGLEENIIYGNPPFSASDNLKVIKDYNISTIISKDSGERGGIYEKIQSAKQSNIEIIIINSPEKNIANINASNIIDILDQRLKGSS